MNEAERNQIKGALLKCAEENENRPTFTGCVVVSSVCRSAVERIEELEALIKSEHEIEARKNNNLISQLDKAKEMLRWFLIYEKGVGIIPNFNNFLNEVAEFINYTE